MPPARWDLDVVAKTLGAACELVRPGEAADAVGGRTPALVASPSSTAQASALMRVAGEHDLAVLPRGSGSRLHWGVPPSRCDLVIETARMSQVIEHAAGDLVARVQAGARIGDVAAVLAAAGQEIALDVPLTATIGGVIADALAGPRRLRYGSPRDLLIGITIVRADGTVARSGGKVVKNVAGYDLGKIFAGSAGTLGLITEATFRLHPLPAARAWVTATLPGSAAAGRAVADAANSPLVASAVELDRPGPGAPVGISVLLEGSADGVAARAERMASLVGGTVTGAPPRWWQQGAPEPGSGVTLVRVSCWVSWLGGALDAVDSAAVEAGVQPAVSGSAGAGLLYVTLPGAPWERAARFVRLIRDAIPAGRGSAVVLSAPDAARTAPGADGMAGNVPAASLMRAVKDQFDPGGRMAPGREGFS
jgi:glycolate oxidase FAD binding subunit